MGGPVGGCRGGQDEPARSVQSASHGGTDPPKVTFEARLTTFTSNVVPSGRLSRLRRWEAVKAPKWPISRAPPSAGDRPGLGDVDGRAAERLPDGIELPRRGAPTCCGRRHRPGSDSRRRWFTRWLAHGGYGAATSAAPSARNDITSLRFPLHRYGIRRLSTLLGLAGRRLSSTRQGWRTLYSTVGSTAAFGYTTWCGLQFYSFSSFG